MHGHVIVFGAEPLTQVIVEDLLERGASVVLVAETRSGRSMLRELERRGARIIDGSRFAVDDLGDAGIDTAAVLVLTDEDDTGNADGILFARRVRGDLP